MRLLKFAGLICAFFALSLGQTVYVEPAAAESQFAQVDSFRAGVQRIFSPSILEDVDFKNGHGEIVFHAPKVLPDYFEAGDKVNKIFALESARLFRDMPTLKSLDMAILVEGEARAISLERGAVEDYYSVDFTQLSDKRRWQSFVADNDSNEMRQAFVDNFR
ncbi:hypothetical protein [Salinicola socius]|uniref:DUF3016 domain-containing protein n=1 Tax=Salinicola socius TaxID=404433 RepID=A0A1Q8SUL0_9GAMM|nr:hypothetical protein [Salinicola socius]OLO05093.1 hypothetical protein BTW07_05625 [Salinicola socius]